MRTNETASIQTIFDGMVLLLRKLVRCLTDSSLIAALSHEQNRIEGLAAALCAKIKKDTAQVLFFENPIQMVKTLFGNEPGYDMINSRIPNSCYETP